MRSPQPSQDGARDLRQRVWRLDGIPLRAATARFILAETGEDSERFRAEMPTTPRWRTVVELDPGWALAACRSDAPDPLAVVAGRPWWDGSTRAGADVLALLWRHAVAVSLAARRLAREADDPDADRIARAGLLHGLGLWAVAAVDLDGLARWLAIDDPGRRRDFERGELGTDFAALGRTLAERWSCDPLVVDAAWLHDGRARRLIAAAAEPGRLALIQEAFRLAERTPWSLIGRSGRGGPVGDPRVKLLIAEVQSRCATPFLEPDANPREESLSRSNALLRLRLQELEAGVASRDRFLELFGSTQANDDPESWSERASRAWCAEPGVSAARVVWEARRPAPGDPFPPVPAEVAAGPGARRPALEVPLGDRAATVLLWREPDGPGIGPVAEPLLSAWTAWASWVVDRQRAGERFNRVVAACRDAAESADDDMRSAKLAALGEFAGGAGHELNNPLAVIVGRAQLLLVRETDPAAARSLRTILSQAQRAHRLLRDLMYVARPPEPRARFCLPDDILRSSLRDARDDAEAREVRLVSDALEHGRRVWADPDGLRHLADSLVRNALEATPKGGQVRVSSRGDATYLRWSVEDSGRGITPADGEHLFDPFYCGRQAGRGLGLGLPRAARFLGQLGGDIHYQSQPGLGSVFHVRLPLSEPPRPPTVDATGAAAVPVVAATPPRLLKS